MQGKITNDEKEYTFSSVDEAVDIIKNIYAENEVCLGEILASININDCSIEDIINIAAKVRKEVDDWEICLVDENNIIENYSTNEDMSNLEIVEK